MKIRISFLLAVALLCLLATRGLAGPGEEPKPAGTLCVMSYNLRYASQTPPNAWPQRRPLIAELVRSISPDLIGTQEGLYLQLKEIAEDLPEYAWIGLGREGGSKSEFMAIFYKKLRFEAMAFDHFWLSDTPAVIGSSSWGNSNKRMVTWVRFRDRDTGREFYHFNTHLDHEIQLARERGAELIRQRVSDLKTALPVLLTGDFNASADNKAYAILTSEDFLRDTWNLAKERRGDELGTFNGFREVPRNNTRIDWILARGTVEVDATEIVTFARDGQFPSDHFPIVTWLRLVN